MGTEKEKEIQKKKVRAKKEIKLKEEEEDVLDSSILDREPLCARSLSDTLSHMRRRGFLGGADDRNAVLKGHGPDHSHIGISNSKAEKVAKNWDVDAVQKWLGQE